VADVETLADELRSSIDELLAASTGVPSRSRDGGRRRSRPRIVRAGPSDGVPRHS
jgi:hypothetical protein